MKVEEKTTLKRVKWQSHGWLGEQPLPHPSPQQSTPSVACQLRAWHKLWDLVFFNYKENVGWDWIFQVQYFQTGTPCFIALCRLKVCGSPSVSKPISTIFPAAFPNFLSLPHVGNSCSIWNCFISSSMCVFLLLGDLWSMILDAAVIAVIIVLIHICAVNHSHIRQQT